MSRSRHLVDDPDPAVVTAALRDIWRIRGDRVDAVFEVPDCPYSAAELAELSRQRRRPAFLPARLATQDGRARLAALFPPMESWAVVADSIAVNDQDAWGWFDYETVLDSPNPGTDEAGLLAETAADGRTLLTLNQYIVAGQDTVLLTGHHLDEAGTWSRVCSRIDGRMVSCRFDGPAPPDDPFGEEPLEGSLLVSYDLGSSDRGARTGARSSLRRPDSAPPVAPRTSYDLRRLPAPVIEDLGRERERQVEGFLALGYHRRLDMSAAEYAASLPRLSDQPAGYAHRFDVPLLVETRLDWRTQTQLAGIAIGGGRLHLDYVSVDERSAIPAEPYAAWFTWWGGRFPSAVAPDDARALLADDEVGASMNELVAMQVAHPGLNEAGRFFEPIGAVLDGTFATGLTGFDDDVLRTACLYRWRGRPEVGANLHPKAIGVCRPLVRGAAVTR